jgi:opacity protein-like surface antigen
MKSFLLSFAFILFLSTSAISQVAFGIKAGPAISNTYEVLGDTISGFSDAQITYLAGGFMRFDLSKKLGLQTELLYSLKGNFNTDYGYISLPIMLQYEFLPNLRAEAGLEAAYLLSAQMEFISGNRLDERSSYKDFDLGVNFGINYDFLEKFTAGLRYNLGLVNTWNDEPRFGIGTDSSVKNHSLQLSLGYRFGR